MNFEELPERAQAATVGAASSPAGGAGGARVRYEHALDALFLESLVHYDQICRYEYSILSFVTQV